MILTTLKRLSTSGFDRQGRDPQQRPAELPDRPCQAQRLWMRKRCGKPGKTGHFIFKPYEIEDINHENGGFCLCSMVDGEAIDSK